MARLKRLTAPNAADPTAPATSDRCRRNPVVPGAPKPRRVPGTRRTYLPGWVV